MSENQDIVACVGDCLGAVSSIRMFDITVTPSTNLCYCYDTQQQSASLGLISDNENHSFLFAFEISPLSEQFLRENSKMSIKISWKSTSNVVFNKSIEITLPKFPDQSNLKEGKMEIDEEAASKQQQPKGNVNPALETQANPEDDFSMFLTKKPNASELHVATHLLRVRSALLMHKVARKIEVKDLLKTLENVHAMVLQLLGDIQSAQDYSNSTVDEGILVSLENNLGQMVEVISEDQPMDTSMNEVGGGGSSKRGTSALFAGRRGKGGRTVERYCRFLQFSIEHLHQKSTASASQFSVMSPYATTSQLQMRLKFLRSFMPKASSHNGKQYSPEDKLKLERAEPNLTAEELENRKTMDEDVSCFVSLENWRSSQLGIGLLVKPRTSRERYRHLVPRVEIVSDYVSAESYNLGVRTKAAAAAAPVVHGQNNQQQQQGQGNNNNNVVIPLNENEEIEQSSTLTSSARSRINAWLPLYVNETNWQSGAKFWCSSAFSIIATQFNDAFEPQHALQVCSKLMIQTIVKCLIDEAHISEQMLQMYCDVHRLFLAMCDEYPDIRKQATLKLKQFAENPNSRSRSATPDLGDLINYLTVVDDVSWDDLQTPYVLEMFRRNAFHIPVSDFNLTSMSSVQELNEKWMKVTNSGRVTMFNVLFLRLLRPKGSTAKSVCEMYDKNWGRVPSQIMSQLKEGANKILHSVDNLQQVMYYLGVSPDLQKPSISDTAIAELLVWAFENRLDFAANKFYTESDDRYMTELPKKLGPYVKRWRFKHRLWKKSQTNPPPVLIHWDAPKPSGYGSSETQVPKERNSAALSVMDFIKHAILDKEQTTNVENKNDNTNKKEAKKNKQQQQSKPKEASVHSENVVSVECKCDRCLKNTKRNAELEQWRKKQLDFSTKKENNNNNSDPFSSESDVDNNKQEMQVDNANKKTSKKSKNKNQKTSNTNDNNANPTTTSSSTFQLFVYGLSPKTTIASLSSDLKSFFVKKDMTVLDVVLYAKRGFAFVQVSKPSKPRAALKGFSIQIYFESDTLNECIQLLNKRHETRELDGKKGIKFDVVRGRGNDANFIPKRFGGKIQQQKIVSNEDQEMEERGKKKW